MDADLTVTLINATVQIDQPVSDSKRMVGTGFLVAVPSADGGPPEIVLVTAAHVFEKMPANEVRIGWRVQAPDGGWQYSPSRVAIRTPSGGALWYQNPKQDVAVIAVEVPPSYQDAAIPLEWLADEKTFEQLHIGPGDEMMTLGYPHGLSANTVGFPILRSGRLASYPLGPVASYPTFLIDLTAIPGNSGGPVFMTDKASRAPDTEMPPVTFVSGILTKQVELENQRLELGLVTHAVFVRQTITQMQTAEARKSASLSPSEARPPVILLAPVPIVTEAVAQPSN